MALAKLENYPKVGDLTLDFSNMMLPSSMQGLEFEQRFSIRELPELLQELSDDDKSRVRVLNLSSCNLMDRTDMLCVKDIVNQLRPPSDSDVPIQSFHVENLC